MQPFYKTGLVFFFIVLFFSPLMSQNWKPAKNPIITQWGEKLNPESPLPEYPRPQMERSEWKNLNGLWDYTIRSKHLILPELFDSKILVPFPIESALSGVKKTVGKENLLWYRKIFDIPDSWKGKRIILHFGAVDWETEIYINKKFVGSHRGGYDSFSFDITDFLTGNSGQEIILSVWDPSNDGFQPRGKQVNKPGGIWYTSVTGIWQTVWIEPVNTTYIRSLKLIPDIDEKILWVNLIYEGIQDNDEVELIAVNGAKEIFREKFYFSDLMTLQIENPKLWSPDNPFLYKLKISLMRNGNTIDQVDSYFAMRKISVTKDPQGIPRLYLNNKFLFQFGTLDQGWWPDGLYTAPTDEALFYDIEKLKQYGFNLIRKHVKVEPERYYYHCDRLGMLVWQDMPSGDSYASSGDNNEIKRIAQSEYQFEKELKSMIDQLYNYPSIIVWVPFNEGWGQFNTISVINWIKHFDPYRLLDGPSGWSDFYGAGDIQDKHDYPGPSMPEDKKDNRALALGEFGGLGLPVENHTWRDKDNWGYRSFNNSDDLRNSFISLIDRFPELIRKGLSAAIYTQTTDVEIEVNGLLTYDRKVDKMGAGTVRDAIRKLYEVVK
mgnify:CR=1 FL=1